MDPSRLSSVPLFEGLSGREREQVAEWADEVDIPAGKHLLDEGRFAHEFFVILDGQVEVTKDGQHLVDLGAGDFFGEIALLETERRTATVVASTPVLAIVMHSRDFLAMKAELPQVAERVHEAIRDRMTRG